MSLPVEHRQAHLCGQGFRPTAATATSGRPRTQAENKDAGLGKAAGEVVGTRHPKGEGRERGRRHRGADPVPQVGKALGAGRGSWRRRRPRLQPAK